MPIVCYRHQGARAIGVLRQGLIHPLDADAAAIKALLSRPQELDARIAQALAAPGLAQDQVEFLPTLFEPEKIFCVGVNYADRNEEYKDGSAAPAYPSLFMRT